MPLFLSYFLTNPPKNFQPKWLQNPVPRHHLRADLSSSKLPSSLTWPWNCFLNGLPVFCYHLWSCWMTHQSHCVTLVISGQSLVKPLQWYPVSLSVKPQRDLRICVICSPYSLFPLWPHLPPLTPLLSSLQPPFPPCFPWITRRWPCLCLDALLPAIMWISPSPSWYPSSNITFSVRSFRKPSFPLTSHCTFSISFQ